MVKLARVVIVAIVEDHGSEDALRRLSDPFWFQAFGCLLGFDPDASGRANHHRLWRFEGRA